MSDPRQLAFAFEHRPALAGDDFLVAASNREAIAWLDAWPAWSAPLLVIHGPAGAGKSHLGQVYRARSGAVEVTMAQLAGEAFTDVAEGLIDDAEAMPQEPLLHLYNLVAARGGHLLLTAQRPPAAWDIGLADLRSRLLAAPAIAIGQPEDDLIKAVLAKLFSDRQLRIEADVVEYLARRMERSLAEAARLVDAIDRAALSERRDITLPLVRDVLTRL